MATRKFYRKNFKYHLKKTFSFVFKAGFVLVILGTLALFSVFAYYARNLPDPTKAIEKEIPVTSKIFASDGETLLYEIHGDQRRTLLTGEQIPKNIKQATLSVEDQDFYNHLGIDISGILRAVWVNFKRGRLVQGGSTITQQFIKNSILTPERTIERKIKEWILALEMERQYSKDEILTFYLNQVPYGRSAYGVEAASETYFQKPASKLSLAEAATLASLPKAPTYYGTHLEELETRRNYVLEKMYSLGYISRQDLKKAKNEEIMLAPRQQQMRAPHFVEYVRSFLEKKLGSEVIERRSREKGGLKIITTLDWELQKKGEQMIEDAFEKRGGHYKFSNGSLVAVNPQNGEIITMIGSRDFFSEKIDGQVNVSLRPRQPGSSFKPLVYATAIEEGFTPQTMLFDVETEFNPNCPADADRATDQYGLGCYHPSNYDEKTRGPVSFRSALAQSLNIPAVKALHLAGIEKTRTYATKAGISTLENKKDIGLSLALGGTEVKLLDLTAAFGLFGQDGALHSVTPIKEVEGLSQEEEKKIFPEQEKRQVFSKKTARAIADILSDNQARAPMFGSYSALYIPEIPAGAKTGTSQEYRDAWTIGFSPKISVGVWVGNNDDTEMVRGAVGAAVAAPIWKEFIQEALKDKSNSAFSEPAEFKAEKPMLNGSLAGEKKVKIDKISEKLATEHTPEPLIEEKTYKQAHSILHYVNPENPRGPIPSEPDSDPQYENWEKAVQNWIDEQSDPSEYNQSPPSEDDDVHVPENKPEINFEAPKKESRIKEKNLEIKLKAEANLGIDQIDLFLNSTYLKTLNKSPWRTKVTIPVDEKTCSGDQTLTARAYDEVLNSAEAEVEITTDLSCPEKSLELELQLEEKNNTPASLFLSTSKSVEEGGIEFYYYNRENPSQVNSLGKNTFSTATSSFEQELNLKLEPGEYIFYATLSDEKSDLHTSDQVTYTVSSE